jgi:hypothetical protein
MDADLSAFTDLLARVDAERSSLIASLIDAESRAKQLSDRSHAQEIQHASLLHHGVPEASAIMDNALKILNEVKLLRDEKGVS